VSGFLAGGQYDPLDPGSFGGHGFSPVVGAITAAVCVFAWLVGRGSIAAADRPGR
jgi:hypothetical protein